MDTNKLLCGEDLGWANSDPDLFRKLQACREAGHEVWDLNLDHSMHGYDTAYGCATCGWHFHCDSSG